MASPPPLEVPSWYDVHSRRWITEVTHDRRPALNNPAISADQLRADDSDRYETFLRVSHGALAFESARWSMVMAGASHFGQLARPRLRWPGIRESISTAAEASGTEARPSAPGKVANFTASKWGGRDRLIADLLPSNRHLLDRFLAGRGKDGPLEKEADAKANQPRIRLHNRCLVPFPALDGAGEGVDVRSWLDARLRTGAVRTGLILNCSVCPWTDFYPVDNVGSSFTCARCGSSSALTSARWRKPEAGPIWYYELHPTAAEFFAQNGDGPLLAAHHHPRAHRTEEIDFELEFLNPKTGRSWAEIDFAILGWDGLVIGEAKTSGALKATNAKGRIAEVDKKLLVAAAVGASEVCFATVGSWSKAAHTAIVAAIAQHRPRADVTTLEHIETRRAKFVTLQI